MVALLPQGNFGEPLAPWVTSHVCHAHQEMRPHRKAALRPFRTGVPVTTTNPGVPRPSNLVDFWFMGGSWKPDSTPGSSLDRSGIKFHVDSWSQNVKRPILGLFREKSILATGRPDGTELSDLYWPRRNQSGGNRFFMSYITYITYTSYTTYNLS